MQKGGGQAAQAQRRRTWSRRSGPQWRRSRDTESLSCGLRRARFGRGGRAPMVRVPARGHPCHRGVVGKGLQTASEVTPGLPEAPSGVLSLPPEGFPLRGETRVPLLLPRPRDWCSAADNLSQVPSQNQGLSVTPF
ncbi:hypothetical protein NN561_015397 [Cricetulus griseus]